MRLSDLEEKTLYVRMYPNVDGKMLTTFRHYYSIYSLVNAKNGKRYVGRTQNPKSRIKTHLCLLKSGKHPNELLNHDAGQQFDFEILQNGILDADEAKRQERYYMLKFKTYDSEFGYNCNDPMMRKRNRKQCQE